MRKTFGAIGAALAIVVAMATSTAPAGFPNGRRLADDVTDIELRVIS